MEKMTAQAMDAIPEAQAGAYKTSFWFQIIATWLDTKFPGAGTILLEAADVIPWSKLWQSIQQALADYQAGMDFLTIFKDVLSKWVDFTPTPDGPKMMAKPA